MDLRVSDAAIDDIVEIVHASGEQYGTEAQARCRALIGQALKDIAECPDSVLSNERPELGDGVRVWHLRNSRDRVRGGKVHRPRHFVLYRVEKERILIGRVLFERMDLTWHVDPRDFE